MRRKAESLVYCIYCGKYLKDNVNYCAQCGRPKLADNVEQRVNSASVTSNSNMKGCLYLVLVLVVIVSILLALINSRMFGLPMAAIAVGLIAWVKSITAKNVG